MTSGAKTRRRDWLRGAAALALVACGLPARAAFELPQLMALLAVHKSGEASFTEQRFVQGLDEPLMATGTLSFVAPDRMTRRTLKPRAESMVVEGNTLTLTRGGRSRSFALDATPEMVAVVEAVRGTLTGNAETLTRHFRTRLAGNAERWTLGLEPIEARLAAQVASLEITGRRGELRTIEMLLTGGDRSLMTIEALRPAQPAAAASK